MSCDASAERCATPTGAGHPSMPTSWPADAPAGFHLLAKPTGGVCNLDCEYCFYLSKDALYPDGTFRMDDELLELYVRQVIEAQGAAHVTIAWQGGEPTLLGTEFFERAFSLVAKHRRPNMHVEHTLQTNGTRLDDAWCELLRRHGVLVGLSIDGPRAAHDAYRVDKSGRGTFDSVVRAARLLQKHGVDFNVLCTVHAANADKPLEVYRFFRDELAARFIQLIPIVERVGSADLVGVRAGRGKRPLYVQAGRSVTDRSVEPAQWGRFLIAIFDEWVRRDVGTVFLPTFESALASWMRLPQPMCIFAETCGDALALEHNGDLYSCDHYVEPDYLLGNIRDTHMLELVASPKQRAFGRAKHETLPRHCTRCEVRFACNGECPRNRFTDTPDGEPGLNYLCAGYKAFFSHVDAPMRLMADLLRRGRAPAEIMSLLSRDEQRPLPTTP